MEPLTNNPKSTQQLTRQLASLKVVSRLLSHELHAQSSSKTVTLSRDEVFELQTCIDLFIEEASRRLSPSSQNVSTADAPLVGSRN
ncbi:MAG: hypothetical protein IPK67_10840 [Planctomycetes bacterium]|jgi:hypothetical protein|nr:hypothetical protein [Planctomycetota bacterium]